MLKLFKKVAPALLIACSVGLPSLAADGVLRGTTYFPDYMHSVAGQVFFDNDDAHPGKRMALLKSYSDIGKVAWTAALMITPDKAKDVRMSKLTFEVHFKPQAHKNVKPETVVDWYDALERKEKRTHIKFDSLQRSNGAKDRVNCTIDFSKLVTKGDKYCYVRRIVIGGREIVRSGFNSFMDISIGNVQAYDSDKDKALDLSMNTNVLKITRHSNDQGELRDLLHNLQGESM